MIAFFQDSGSVWTTLQARAHALVDQMAASGHGRLVLPAAIALLVGLVPPARNLFLSIVSTFYVFCFHRPLRDDPQAFLLSSQTGPLPATSSFLSAFRARRILSDQARRRGFRDFVELRAKDGIKRERDIDWSSPGVPAQGDLVESWDRIAEWDDQCIHPTKLQRLRGVGDKLADDALRQVSETVQYRDPSDTDVLGQIHRLAKRGHQDDEGPYACATFWQAVCQRPPPGAGALSAQWYEERARMSGTTPAEHDRWPRHPSRNDINEPDIEPWRPPSAPADSLDSLRDRLSASETQRLLKLELEAEAGVLKRGQDVFYRYAGPMLLSLLHFSLAGGFASPRITEVLRQTAYLVPGSSKRRRMAEHGTSDGNDEAGSTKTPRNGALDDLPRMDKARAERTWARLLETTQFVLDVMESAGSLRPPSSAKSGGQDEGPDNGGQGWQSATRVRLLHTAVRQRVLQRASAAKSPGGYDVDKNGVPINQEDLLATLCSFSVAPLACLQSMGVQPTLQEREDFVALWRHVGFYMGIEPALLRTCFGDARTADRTLWCAILHLFGEVEVSGGDDDDGSGDSDAGTDGEQKPSPPSGAAARRIQGPTIPVLIACADRPPFHTPLSAHFAISRHLLGPSLSDSLGIPRTDAVRTLITDIAFLGMRVPIWFGHLYRGGWEQQRLVLARPLLRRLIVWSFGNKRSRFEMPPRGNGVRKGEDDGGPVPTQTPSARLVDVPEDREDNLRLVRRWQWLMREMVAVCIVAGCAVVGCGGAAVYLLARSWQS